MATASVLKNPFEFESQAKEPEASGGLCANAPHAVRVGEASADLPATSEVMDVTGGESAATSFVLDEAAFMEALDPLPVFLAAPRVGPDREPSRKSQPGIAASLSAVLHALSELVDWRGLGGQRT